MRITDLLRTIDLFAQLPAEDLDHLTHRMRDQHVRQNDVLCRQGEPADAMVIVTAGRIQLSTAEADGRMRTVRELGEGDFFGEIALFASERHTATATAAIESRVLILEQEEFEALVASRPPLMRNMLAAISRRAAQTNRQLVTDQPSATAAPANGHMYPVFSPRGGAGKTTLAVNLAISLAELIPGRVGLLDLDLLFDDAALLLDLAPPKSLATIPEGELERLDARTLSDYLVEHGSSSLRVLVAATRPEDGERVTGAHVRAALAAMKQQFLVTIVDCGSGFAEPTLMALEAADKVIMLCTPELSTLRDVRDCQRIFGQALRLDKSRLMYAFNHPLPSIGLTRQQFETALEQPMALEIPHAGESTAKAAVSAGTVVRATGRGPFAQAIDHLVRDLQPVESRPGDTRTSTGSSTRRASASPNRLLRLLRGSAH
jgi:CRP-like cAMP-binding protein